MKSSRIRRRGPTARTYGFRGAGSCSRASALFIRLLPQGTTLLSRAELEKAGGGYSGVGGCAKRLKCVELARAFESPTTNESASKLDALHTLREVRLRLCRPQAKGPRIRRCSGAVKIKGAGGSCRRPPREP